MPAEFANEKLRLENAIAEYQPQEYPCQYDSSTGSTQCWSECISYHADFIKCPERDLHIAQRKLLRHKMLAFLGLAFRDPKLATGNDLFEDWNLIHSHA